MVKLGYVISSLILVQAFEIHAQNRIIIDSLKASIHSSYGDTSVCTSYLMWGEELYLYDPDTALILYQKAYSISKDRLTQDLSPAFEKSYLLSSAHALSNIGVIFWGRGNVSKALTYFHESLSIDEKMGNKYGIAVSIYSIGLIYKRQGDIPEALEYFYRSLKIREEIGDQHGVAIALNSIGNIHSEQGNIPKSLEYHLKSLKIRETIGDNEGIAISLNNLGGLYTKEKQIPQALEYYQRSLSIRKDIGDKRGIAISLINIAGIQLDQSMFGQALENCRNGLLIARQIGSPRLISAHSLLLSRIAKKQYNYKEALKMYELHVKMRDSIKNEETQKAAIRQHTKYEFEKAQLIKEQNQKERARLKAETMQRRDNLQYSIILICLLILSAAILSLGYVKVSLIMAEGIIFFSFLILFEFLLVLADPYVDSWSDGAPGIKLLFNAGIAALIFPAHAFFESKLKSRLVNKGQS